jgi:hypothetical protein
MLEDASVIAVVVFCWMGGEGSLMIRFFINEDDPLFLKTVVYKLLTLHVPQSGMSFSKERSLEESLFSGGFFYFCLVSYCWNLLRGICDLKDEKAPKLFYSDRNLILYFDSFLFYGLGSSFMILDRVLLKSAKYRS